MILEYHTSTLYRGYSNYRVAVVSEDELFDELQTVVRADGRGNGLKSVQRVLEYQI